MENKFEYKTTTEVKLNGKVVGHIKHIYPSFHTTMTRLTPVSYQYFPKGSKEGGKKYSTIYDCTYSLENDN